MKTTSESYGGGNQFGNALIQFLREQGDRVVFDLIDTDIDIILLTEPRPKRASAHFGPIEIERYLRKINPAAIIIHRINECDERKGTRTVNRVLCMANQMADHTVYIATWLIPLFQEQGLRFTPSHSVILNGGDRSVFVYKQKKLPEKGKIRLVTHHWSSHPMKGWDIYHHIDDRMEQDSDFRNRFEFHYIGNAPQQTQCRHIQFHEPVNGVRLAEKLSDCHVYVTGSICEPAGMHHVEGALCGLPLLFRESGALPEYCRGYGVSFKAKEDLMASLEALITQYDTFQDALRFYENSAQKMCEAYHGLFHRLLRQRDDILRARPRGFYGLRKAASLKSAFTVVRLMHMLGVQ